MKRSDEMSWKAPRRTLQNAPKVKLTYGHPLPENVDDITPVYEFAGDGQRHTQFQRNGSCIFSEFSSSLPVASQTFEDNYFNNFDKLSLFDQEGDSDLERALLSDFGETDGSSFDDSGASFFSWTDEMEVQRASKDKDLFEELEMALYDEEPPLVKDEELSSECVAWKNRHIYLRVVGQKPSYCPEKVEQFEELENECGEIVNDEIIANHGFLEESPKPEASTECLSITSTPRELHSGKLIEKVKVTVLDQLAFYALSEAMKSFEQHCITEIRPKNLSPQVNSAVSSLANLSEDLGRVLKISGRSIHRSPKVVSSECGKKAVFVCSPEHVHTGHQSKRFSSSINVIPEDTISVSPSHSFSVLGIPKPLNSEDYRSKTKILEKRGFHSAADRKKPGIVGRRFSCISPDHDKLLKLSLEGDKREENITGDINSKQISAPNTPAKLLRHLTLPPIQNINSYKFSVSPDEKSQHLLTHARRIFVKNKVSLSPLPNASNPRDDGMTELQLAKKLLESTPETGQWRSRRKSGISGTRSVKSRKKTVDKFTNNP